jgi:hypothetical protein
MTLLYRNQTVEQRAEVRLAELTGVLKRPLEPPVPIDLVAEQVLGLDFLWTEIEEWPGEVILGGLIARRRLIVLNERHRDLFERKPGLERSTKGHEMGHWDLFVDRATLDHPSLPGLESDEGPALRRSDAGPVAVVHGSLLSEELLELVRELDSRTDHPAEARAVNRYAAAISMPRSLICPAALAINRTSWPELYRLAEQFEVTITALRVRLEQLGLLGVGGDGRLYASREVARGQASLW